MTIPTAPIAIPDVVRHIAAARPVHPVWVNELGGVTPDASTPTSGCGRPKTTRSAR